MFDLKTSTFSSSNIDLDYDIIIVGGGVYGLSLGCTILERQPSKSVCILERGILPMGASSRNAGFGTFVGYIEFVNEVESKGWERASKDMLDRYTGLQMLLKRVNNDPEIVKLTGCYDIIYEQDIGKLDRLEEINDRLRNLFPGGLFSLRRDMIPILQMDNGPVRALVHNPLEWQINTGKFLIRLMKQFQSMGGIYLTACEVTSHYLLLAPSSPNQSGNRRNASSTYAGVNIKDPTGKGPDHTLKCKTVIFCINSFAKTLVKNSTIVPGRGQVMITKPIPTLNFESNFFADYGYYYMRTVNGRILLGGARHLQRDIEETHEFVNTPFYKDHLPNKLREFFPRMKFEVDFFWSGIMGFNSNSGQYTIEKIDEGVFSVFGCQGNGMCLTTYVTSVAHEVIFGLKSKL
jgi:gamma-glutamylputrescine oxidase